LTSQSFVTEYIAAYNNTGKTPITQIAFDNYTPLSTTSTFTGKWLLADVNGELPDCKPCRVMLSW
jgi:hypothetical protein